MTFKFFKKSFQQFKQWCRGNHVKNSSTPNSIESTNQTKTDKVVSLDSFSSDSSTRQTTSLLLLDRGKDTPTPEFHVEIMERMDSSICQNESHLAEMDTLALPEPTTETSEQTEWVEVQPLTPTIQQESIRPVRQRQQPGELYQKVAQIPIIDILIKYGFYTGKRPTRGAINISCPLPGHQHQSTRARKQGSMRIDLAANKATCWSSNCSHHKRDFKNGMSLLAAIRGDKNQQYVKHLIAKDFGIISEETFQRFLSGEALTNYEVYEPTTYQPHQTVCFYEELAPVETIDLVIRALMTTFRAHCGYRNDPRFGLLSPEDFTYLHEERQLSESFIKEGYYFTFPSEHFFPTFVEVLLKNKIIADPSELNTLLKGVPGFYFNKHTQQWSYATLERDGRFFAPKGIGIPIQNANKKFTGIQIRKRFVGDGGNRYTWHTSKYFVGDDFDYGITPGTPVSVVFPKEIKRKTLFITEGHFKAKRLADTFDCIAISVQGVSNFKGIEKEIKTLIHHQQLTFNHILIAYDADLAGKKEVLRQSKNLIEHLKTELAMELKQTNLLFVGWDIQFGKGIDDVIESGHQQKLSRIPADVFLMACDEMFQTAGSMENWSEDDRMKAYNLYVLSKFPNYEHLLHQQESA